MIGVTHQLWCPESLEIELARYWFVRLALINGIGLFAAFLSVAAALAPELPEVEKVGWMGWMGWMG